MPSEQIAWRRCRVDQTKSVPGQKLDDEDRARKILATCILPKTYTYISMIRARRQRECSSRARRNAASGFLHDAPPATDARPALSDNRAAGNRRNLPRQPELDWQWNVPVVASQLNRLLEQRRPVRSIRPSVNLVLMSKDADLICFYLS